MLNEQDLPEILGERPYQRRHHDAPVDAEQEPVNLPEHGNESPAEEPTAEKPPPVESGGDGALPEEDTLRSGSELS